MSCIDQNWIATKWSKICSHNLSSEVKKNHCDTGTQVERAKYQGKVNQYFSKTMAYIAKGETWKRQSDDEELLEWMKTFGKHWGVICRDKLKEMIDVVVCQFDTTTHFYQVRRGIKNHIQSCRRSELGDNYNHKVGKLLDKIFSMKDTCNHSAFIPDDLWSQR